MCHHLKGILESPFDVIITAFMVLYLKYFFSLILEHCFYVWKTVLSYIIKGIIQTFTLGSGMGNQV